MSLTKGELLYEGKAKKIYAIEGDSHLVWMEFKDSLTAFNAEKKAEMQGKGQLNHAIASLIFDHLKKNGIESHLVEVPGPTAMVCKKVEIIPLEVVVRNTLAGSTAKRFGIPEGQVLKAPLVEFYYKKDELSDPFCSDAQITTLELGPNQETLDKLKTLGLEVNNHLKELFFKAGIDLIDFKLEFGVDPEGQIILSDEISPDSCRLWDIETREKMDKDRFRRDLGLVLEKYAEVLQRLTQVVEGQ